MNSRPLLLASIALNVVAVAMLLVGRSQRAATPSADAPTASSPAAAPRPQPRSAANAAALPAPEAFHWRKLESSDYAAYIGNLRAIGCPEETIRDIIVADVAKVFAQKLASHPGAVRSFNWWQGGVSQQKLLADNRRLARDLERERWTLLRELLGPAVESEVRKNSGSADPLNDELVYGFLPEPKRAAVREIAERFTLQEQELQQRGFPAAARNSPESRKLRETRAAELAQFLTPEEIEEYALRSSPVAETLRARLASLPTSEEQFRQMFRAQREFEETYLAGRTTNASGEAITPEKRQAAQRELDAAYQRSLGETAFAEYKRSQDPSWRSLQTVARDHNLTAETTAKVYQLRQAVEEQTRQLFAERGAPVENRAATLKSVVEETEKALGQLLAPAAVEALKQNGGWWIPSANGNTITFRAAVGDGMVVRSISTESSTITGTGGTAPVQVIVQPTPRR